MLNNKNILITGGTGSLGKELTKTILQRWPNVERYTVFRGVLMLVPLLRVLDRLLGSVLG